MLAPADADFNTGKILLVNFESRSNGRGKNAVL